jgi:hypothetical protein
VTPERREEGNVPGFISDSPLSRDLIRIGNEAIAHDDDAKLRDCFAEDYVFHGPGGDLGFEELRAYFASLRQEPSRPQRCSDIDAFSAPARLVSVDTRGGMFEQSGDPSLHSNTVTNRKTVHHKGRGPGDASP